MQASLENNLSEEGSKSLINSPVFSGGVEVRGSLNNISGARNPAADGLSLACAGTVLKFLAAFPDEGNGGALLRLPHCQGQATSINHLLESLIAGREYERRWDAPMRPLRVPALLSASPGRASRIPACSQTPNGSGL